MPRVAEDTISGYQWCPDGMCDGNIQQPVEVVKQVVEFTMLESGGDSNQVEKGFTYFRFADGEDHECEHCGRQMEVGDQLRPVYPASNWDPDGLRKLIRDGVTAARGKQEPSELDELKELLRAQQEQIAALQQKRGPGRPPKTEEAHSG